MVGPIKDQDNVAFLIEQAYAAGQGKAWHRTLERKFKECASELHLARKRIRELEAQQETNV